jgi:BMFP domain-containing protein YqiC
MEPDPSDLSREELEQRIAELEAQKKEIQQQSDKAVAER